jgi:hypothetical protein
LGAGEASSRAPRQQSIRIDDLIVNRGGFDTAVKTGFGVIVVRGNDPEGVNLQGFVVNSHTSAFDSSVFGCSPQEIVAARVAPSNAVPETRKTFVLPHVLEKSGTIAAAPDTFDTLLYATYAGDLPGATAGTGATVNLYLYDSKTGVPLTGAVADVCNPCTFDLSSRIARPPFPLRN